MPRRKIEIEEPEEDAQIEETPETLDDVSGLVWVPSGAVTSNLVLSGDPDHGYPLGRIVNIVGDRSSGKTLLAIEALANFVSSVGRAEHAKYADAEEAFDERYGKVLGMPSGVKTCPDGLETVEDFRKDLEAFLNTIPEGEGCMYVLDSLDALSDDAEMEADESKASFGTTKAKYMSKFFRKLVGLIARKNCLLIIISQLRDKIGVVFGEKQTRSGGRALDFYASQIIWLSEVGKIRKKALGIERVTAIETRFRTKKNKVALAFRECELTIVFNYGIDDEISMLRWLKEANVATIGKSPLATIEADLRQARVNRERDVINDIRDELIEVVAERWADVEAKLAPPIRKYT